MKRLLVLFIMVFPLVCMAQLMPIQRNFFTTNPAPIVEVVAGSNATVQASLVGVNTRRFTVNSTAVGGSGQTNNTVITQGTNTIITSSSGGGTTTYDVNAITDTNVVSIIATNVAAYESSLATNDLWSSTMGLSNSVFQAGTNWAGTAKQDATNALWTATMGLSNSVFQAGTNWAGTAKTDATNGLWTAAKDLTNTTGLKVYATNVLSGGQLPIGTVATNTAFDGAFLTATNNGTARVWTRLGDPLTNSSGYSLASMADTNWTLTQIAQAGAYEYFGGPTNGFAITNSGETVSRTNVFTSSVAPFVNASTSTVSTLVLNAYARHSISTNKFDRIAAGPVAIETYPFRTGGAGTISGHYEFYAVDCVSNIMYELGSGPVFTISATAPTLITTSFVITNGFTATNKCYAAVAFKFDAIGIGGPTVSWAHGGVYAAHLNFVRPLSSATIDGSQVVSPVTNAYNAVYATNFVGHVLTGNRFAYLFDDFYGTNAWDIPAYPTVTDRRGFIFDNTHVSLVGGRFNTGLSSGRPGTYSDLCQIQYGILWGWSALALGITNSSAADNVKGSINVGYNNFIGEVYDGTFGVKNSVIGVAGFAAGSENIAGTSSRSPTNTYCLWADTNKVAVSSTDLTAQFPIGEYVLIRQADGSNASSQMIRKVTASDYTGGNTVLTLDGSLDNTWTGNTASWIMNVHDGGNAGATAFGTENRAFGANSFVAGYRNTVKKDGTGSVSFGVSNNVVSEGSVAFGQNNLVSGKYSYVSGSNCNAAGNWNVVLGQNNTNSNASADSVFISGKNNLVTGIASTAIGNGAYAMGGGSFVQAGGTVSATGDSQCRREVWYGKTLLTSTNYIALTNNGGIYITLQNLSYTGVKARVVGIRTVRDKFYDFELTGGYYRSGGTYTEQFQTGVTNKQTTASIVARLNPVASNGLSVEVCDLAGGGETIKWTATVELTETVYP